MWQILIQKYMFCKNAKTVAFMEIVTNVQKYLSFLRKIFIFEVILIIFDMMTNKDNWVKLDDFQLL